MKTTLLLSLLVVPSAHAFCVGGLHRAHTTTTTLAAMQDSMDDGPDFDGTYYCCYCCSYLSCFSQQQLTQHTQHKYTAPSARAAAVGNAVRSPPPKNPLDFLMDDFNGLQKTTPASTTTMMDDDECYLGKDGTADDCVDFDPPAVQKSP